ncbi:MAG TPA: xanthine dehydrogenase family protein molybdopterin-binding subunit [Stellaceae bacterium]
MLTKRLTSTEKGGLAPKLSERGLSRRTFIKAGAAAGGGLVLSFTLPVLSRHAEAAAPGKPYGGPPNAYVRIAPDNSVTMIVPRVEMGQGTYTSLPMLIAEELEIDLNQVRLEHAPPDAKSYSDPLLGEQATGGSTAIRGAFDPLRRVGAVARTMLVAAAAQQWRVDAAACRGENGEVIHVPTGRRIAYGAVADAAAKLRVPAKVKLKDPKHFTLIGTPAKRLDQAEKVNGRAQFGIDVRPPGLKVATVAASPVFGGKLASVDDSKAKAVNGVRQVVRIDNAVAVVADHMGAARKGLAALAISWDDGANAKLSTADIVRQLADASRKGGLVAEKRGDVDKALAGAAKRIEAVYEMPFLAHATMEPMNCTVHVRTDGCDVWVGTQVPVRAQVAAAQVTGLPQDKVQVHNQFLGGGFGRRLDVDGIAQAVEIAKQVDGPVKVIWSREEDTQHDVYRPYYYDRLAAGLDAHGAPIAFTHRVTGSFVAARWAPWVLKNGLDPDAAEAAAGPYAFPNLLVDCVRQEPPAGLTTGWWRGVGPTHNCFMVESFIDELAAAAGKDPVGYRRALLGKSPRARAVLDLAARQAGWGRPLPKGQGRGVAVLNGFGSYLAQIAEVTVAADGQVRVNRVVSAVDCGGIVNPDTVKAEIEGGIIFGITAALYGNITIENGRVMQANFDTYQPLRIDASPAIEVHLVSSTEAPGGIGEPGTAAIAPAVTNAIFAATGTRLRKLPVDATALKSA